jgi:hypothetical protein
MKKSKEANVRDVTRFRRNQKLKLVEYKGSKCTVCGYSKCPAALDLHHRDPKSKLFGLSERGLGKSWDRVREEADKCDLICSNCHREKHWLSKNL